VLVLAVVATDAAGHPLRGSFDLATLKRLAAEADAPLASLTLDDDDVQWVQRRAVTHMQAAEERQASRRWKEAGWWLALPIVLLAAFWFRRGWVVRWLPVLVLAASLPMPRTAHAADFHVIDAFLTPDQQGRRLFERGDYARAATRFADPMWQGWAYWRAGDYANALTAFAHLDTPEAYLMMGNCNARLKDYPRALAAYDNALKQRPDFAQARANRALVAGLIPKPAKDKDDPQEERTEPEAGETCRLRIHSSASCFACPRRSSWASLPFFWSVSSTVSPASGSVFSSWGSSLSFFGFGISAATSARLALACA